MRLFTNAIVHPPLRPSMFTHMAAVLRLAALGGSFYTVGMCYATMMTSRIETSLHDTVQKIIDESEEWFSLQDLRILFDQIDADNNGTLDKTEVSHLTNLVIKYCLDKVFSSVPTKYAFIFEDVKSLKADALVWELQSQNVEAANMLAQLNKTMMVTLDVDGDDRVTFEEFSSRIPMIVKYCTTACNGLISTNVASKVGVVGIGGGLLFTIGCWKTAGWMDSE